MLDNGKLSSKSIVPQLAVARQIFGNEVTGQREVVQQSLVQQLAVAGQILRMNLDKGKLSSKSTVSQLPVAGQILEMNLLDSGKLSGKALSCNFPLLDKF